MDTKTIFLVRWIIGIILIIGGVTGMIISIMAHVTTKKANYYWSEKQMNKRLKARNFKMNIVRWFRKKDKA